MERFWSKVDKSGECWEWTASIRPNGYGQFYFNGSSIYAHRYSAMLVHGPLDKDIYVCHTCDNKKCVRPEHLFLGLAKHNTQDMISKYRGNNQKKTHCKHGHEFNDDNTYVDGRGFRVCRICDRERKS